MAANTNEKVFINAPKFDAQKYDDYKKRVILWDLAGATATAERRGPTLICSLDEKSNLASMAI